jgi:protein arginine kinase
MIVDDLVKKPGSWLSMDEDTGIVVSSRVRLARNVEGAAFPGWASEDQRMKLCAGLRESFEKSSAVADPLFFDMWSLGEVDKEVLKERHLISNEMTEKGRGSCLVVGENERLAVMINEEDHLRLQAMSPGMNLPSVWKRIDAVDTKLEKHVNYAFSPELGYLTSCPSNVGTGLRASVMMHLPGLRLMNEIEPIVKGLGRIGIEVRGLLGEGTEAAGNMFQISNRTTLGEEEKNVIQQLEDTAWEILAHEQNARARLMEQKEIGLLDHVGRAFGILTHACVLTSREAVDLLSALRLGIELKIVGNITTTCINEVMLLTQPGHLQKINNRVLSPEERDEVRARLIRERIKDITLTRDVPAP